MCPDVGDPPGGAVGHYLEEQLQMKNVENQKFSLTQQKDQE